MSPQPGPAPRLPDGIDDQITLPTAGDTLRRARIVNGHTGYRISCPECGADVADSRRPHTIDASRIADDVDVRGDEIPVYGWYCDRCDITMPADPTDRGTFPLNVGPTNGWLVVSAQLETGSGRVLVPQKEVFIL